MVRLSDLLVVLGFETVDVVADVLVVGAVGMIIMSTVGGYPHLE